MAGSAIKVATGNGAITVRAGDRTDVEIVADFRMTSQERLDATKASYAEIETAGQNAADLYQPFMKDLQDQVTFLGHDLNPAAVASLKPEAKKLNEKADELSRSIDDTIATTNKKIGALRPQ